MVKDKRRYHNPFEIRQQLTFREEKGGGLPCAIIHRITQLGRTKMESFISHSLVNVETLFSWSRAMLVRGERVELGTTEGEKRT